MNAIEGQVGREDMIKSCKITMGFSRLTRHLIQRPGINNVKTDRQ